MTANQPDRIDRLEAWIDNLVTITERLVQSAEIQQQNFEQLVNVINTDCQQAAQDRQQAAQDRQAWQTEIQRIWDYLLRQSGNGR